MPNLIVGLAVFLLLAALLGLFRRSRRRQQIAVVAIGVETLQRGALRKTEYLPRRAGAVVPPDAQEEFAAATRDLRHQGLTTLGDLMEVQPDGTASGPVRWFADGNRTICGWFALARSSVNGTKTPVMVCVSESDAGTFFVTFRGGPRVSLAMAPSVEPWRLDWDDGLARALAHHRGRAGIPPDGSTSTFRRVDGLDDALALFARLRESNAAWRASQPPASLLEQDVRAVLRDRFGELGPELIKLLARRRASLSPQALADT